MRFLERLRNVIVFVVLFVALVASLVLRNPWCDYACPMRTIEFALRGLRRLFGGRTGPVMQD